MEHWTKKNAHQYHQPLEFIKLEPLLTYVLYNLLTDKFNKKTSCYLNSIIISCFYSSTYALCYPSILLSSRMSSIVIFVIKSYKPLFIVSENPANI